MYKKYFGQKNLHVIKYFYLCIKFNILLFSILRLKSDDFENHCNEIFRKTSLFNSSRPRCLRMHVAIDKKQYNVSMFGTSEDPLTYCCSN